MGVNRESVEKIVEAIGGKDNIASATHCVTRLRLALKDESKVDKDALGNIDIVKGSFSANGQFQVVIGQGLVNKVYNELVEITGNGGATKQESKETAEAKLNPLQRLIKTLGDIFIPILPAILAAGILMGIYNVLTGQGIFYEGKSFVEVHKEWAGLAGMINLIANSAFLFLPGLIGWSAVTRFGGSPLLGIVLGLMLVHPDLMIAWGWGDAKQKGEIPVWDLFGLDVQKAGYQGQVLPVLVASFLLAKLEIFLKKRIPDAFQLLLVAPIVLLIVGFLTLIVIGPIAVAIGNAIAHLFVIIFDKVPAIGGFLYGAFYAPLVVRGMHHVFLPLDLQLIASTGGTFLWPIVVMSSIAQGSSALAMKFVSKDEKLRGLSFTSAGSAYLGIIEPALFGINLRFGYPFIAAMTGAAIAGLFIAVNKVIAPAIGIGGLPGFLSIVPQKWVPFFIGMAIAIVVPFAVTFLFGKVKTR